MAEDGTEALVRRAVMKIALLVSASVFFVIAMAWASVSVFLYLEQFMNALQAGLCTTGSALVVGVLLLTVASLRQQQKSKNEFVDILLAALAQSSKPSQVASAMHAQSQLPEKALIAALALALLYGTPSKK